MPDENPRGSVPVPDPTILTTQAVDRALAAYREVVTEQIRNLETRLAGMDRATALLATGLEKIEGNLSSSRLHVREEFAAADSGLRESYELQIKNAVDVDAEKFAAIDTRFLERDTRTEQAAQESRISLDAALAAAKEAVSEQNKANTLAIGKSEAATQKQIDALMAQMATSNKSLEDKITDLKGRLDRGEGMDKGQGDTQARNQWSFGLLLTTGLSLLGAAIAVVLSIVNHR